MMQSPQTPPVRSVSPLMRYQSAERCSLQHEPVQPLPGLNDVRIVLGVAGCAWMFLALATFNQADASFFNIMFPAPVVTNWCGALGAQCAAWLFVVGGPSAWLFVGMMLNSVFARTSMRIYNYAAQIVSGGIILSAAAMLSSLFHVGVAGGGIIGNTLCGYCSAIGSIGSGLLASIALFFASLVFTRCTLGQFLHATALACAYVFYGLSMTWYLLRTGFMYMWPKNGERDDHFVPKPPHKPVIEERLPEESDDHFHIPEIEAVPTAARCTLDRKNQSHKPQEVEINDIAEAGQAQDSSEIRNFEPPLVEGFIVDDEEEEAEEDEILLDGSTKNEKDDDDDGDDDDSSTGGGSGGGGTYHGPTSPEAMSRRALARMCDGGAEESGDPEEAELEEDIRPAVYTEPASFNLPPLKEIFDARGTLQQDEAFIARCKERAHILEEKLMHFGITGQVLNIKPGPVITLFEYEPEVGNKVSRILALEDDLALSLKALSIRILAPIPGKSVVGFEIANEKRESVMFGDMVGEEGLSGSRAHLPLALGVDIVGNPVIADLATMPHLLVAGATGSGKSVGMNVMLVSLLARVTPDKVRIILIDPKRLEFTPYADIPHLLFPIVTNPSDVAPVLKWVAEEMELRYELMAQIGVRNIAEYHKLNPATCFAKEREIGIHVHGMPYMVIMIDELADLIMVGGREIETLIARIAQMARAAGIHMLVATQRPSVDVVTGLIKANFPSRIAFRVSSKIDSRTIIDTSGAEKLLGRGDMLYMSPSNMGGVQRLHGAYVTDIEIDRLTDYLKLQRPASYFSLKQVVARHSEGLEDDSDPLYDEVREFIGSIDEISISLLQRKYRVGFNRSARLIEMLERDGYVAAAQGGKPRRVLRD
ncbi:MAG: segregation ATPase FtsK/SpoIIIE, family [Candidatus Dependentiae bacterium]|nr:segregation ATPase FtsK/SpoIIIE, family [Candidatus Dependentiae bacterium]